MTREDDIQVENFVIVPLRSKIVILEEDPRKEDYAVGPLL